MNSHAKLPTLTEAEAFTPQQIVDLAMQVIGLQHQLDWFKRQLFGQKSERRIDVSSPDQMSLGEVFVTLPTQLPASQTVASR